jgi:hypothetical protein
MGSGHGSAPLQSLNSLKNISSFKLLINKRSNGEVLLDHLIILKQNELPDRLQDW